MAVRLPAFAQRTKANYDNLCFWMLVPTTFPACKLNTSNCTTLSSYRTSVPPYRTTVPYHRTIVPYHVPYLNPIVPPYRTIVPYHVPYLSNHLIVPYVEVRLSFGTTAILKNVNIYTLYAGSTISLWGLNPQLANWPAFFPSQVLEP